MIIEKGKCIMCSYHGTIWKFKNQIQYKNNKLLNYWGDAIVNNNRDNRDNNNDNDSIVHPLHCYDIMRAVTFHWRYIHTDTKRSWEQRTTFLNTRPVLGLLIIFLRMRT